jgi:hypothetical protein
MQVTIDSPDTLAAQLTAAGKDPARAGLEALSVSQWQRTTSIFWIRPPSPVSKKPFDRAAKM